MSSEAEVVTDEAKDAVKRMMAEILPDLVTKVQEKLHEQVLTHFSYQVRAAVDKEVVDFIAATVAPAVRAHLEANKAELLAQVLAAIKSLSQAGMNAIVDQGMKRLTGYEGDKLIESFMRLFSGRY